MKNKMMPTNVVVTKEVYEAPVIETVDVRVEKGFQTTGETPAPIAPPPQGGTAGDYTW